MADWTKSMQQTFEFYIVDPGTWKDTNRLTTVKSCTINRDSEADTLGSATIDVVESLGECYLRVYMITVQNGVTEKHPLGTFLVQTPSSTFDGKIRSVSMDAYTPLLELKEKQPPIGYYVPKTAGWYKVDRHYDEATKTYTYTTLTQNVDISRGEPLPKATTTTGEDVWFGTTVDNEETYYCIVDTFMQVAYRLTRENVRAPVVKPVSPADERLSYDFVSDISDTWFSYLHDLIAEGNYEFSLDELGRILFTPKQSINSLQPVWTYDDNNTTSILYPELTTDHDLYGVPNVVEVIFSNGNEVIYSVAKNTDENSPTSIQSRGREIIHRVTDPEMPGIPSQAQLDEYAEKVLSELSSVEYTISYSHGYCPVRVGDCVRLNYTRAGLTDIKAKVISQSIKCEPGCPVSEKAVFTTKLWR